MLRYWTALPDAIVAVTSRAHSGVPLRWGPALRIGINGLLLGGEGGYRQTGVSRYIESLVRELPAAMPEDELLLFTARGVQAAEGVRGLPAAIGTERPAVRIAWEVAALPVLARRHRLDLFHGTVNALPPVFATPAVVTIHDLAFLRWPEQVPSGRYRYLSWAVRSAVRRARRVLAYSETTKADVVGLLGVRAERVAVMPMGVDARFRPAPPEEMDAFKRLHGVERPFLLAVGTLEPRKNLPRLLEAFAAVRDRVPHDLLLVGPEGWLTGPMHATLDRLRLGERVRLTGYVPDASLPDLVPGGRCAPLPLPL